MRYFTVQTCTGETPLVVFPGLGCGKNLILGKLEGQNPAGSVKDRPALRMIQRAEERGEIGEGDRLLEATSGNTGIALAMVAAVKGYRMTLIMPADMSRERRAVMRSYGAEILLVSPDAGMEGARDLAADLHERGEGWLLDQFANPDNPLAHYETTGPEIWRDTEGQVSHFVSAMGTTGTIMGVSRFLREQDADTEVVGVQPKSGSSIPGIRRWPAEYLPKIYEPRLVDRVIDVGAEEAEETSRLLASQQGVFCGVSSGGAMAAAMRLDKEVEGGVIVVIICDCGDRYLSTGVFPAD